MPELQVIAHHTIQKGREDEVLPLLSQLIAASREEPGNTGFDAYHKFDDPRSYVLLERYTSRGAFAAHRDTTHFKEILLGQIAPRLERRVIEQFDVPDEQP